jgi:hypothetical protein
MNISTVPTKDVNVMTFATDQLLNPSKPWTFYDVAQATRNPFAEAMFVIDGVAGLFVINDFCTVCKAPEAEWESLGRVDIHCTNSAARADVLCIARSRDGPSFRFTEEHDDAAARDFRRAMEPDQGPASRAGQPSGANGRG